VGGKRGEGGRRGRGPARYPFLEAEQERRAQEQRADNKRIRSWWKWLALVAILSLSVAMVYSALEGPESLIILFGALAALFALVLIVFV
jgi:hypothetical protein